MMIYWLVDPVTGETRYVGIASNHKKRLISHIAVARNGRRRHRPNYSPTYCENWIRFLLAKGLKPQMVLVERVTLDNWAERERYWIAHFRKCKGSRLTNLTHGGEGTFGHTQSAEVRAKHGASVRAACQDPEVIRRKSVAARGHYVSEETKARIRAKAIGRRLSEEAKANRRAKVQRICAVIAQLTS